MVDDDRDLVSEAQGGNPDAFGQLFDKHRDRLYTAMLRMTGSREEAADVVQSAFLQAFAQLSSFRGESVFFSWLYRIAFNAVLQRARRRRRTISLDRARGAGVEIVGRGESPTEPLERAERVEIVQAGLAALRPELRAALILREIEGCDYLQIAAILGLSVGTVRSRLHRARLQLREHLVHKTASLDNEG